MICPHYPLPPDQTDPGGGVNIQLFQIKGNNERSNIVANIMPKTPPQTLGVKSIGRNSTFSYMSIILNLREKGCTQYRFCCIQSFLCVAIRIVYTTFKTVYTLHYSLYYKSYSILYYFKKVRSGNTTTAHCRATHVTMRKGHRTVTIHQKDN